MNLRIQTYRKLCVPIRNVIDDTLLTLTDNVSVYQVLDKGLEDLMNMCDVVTDKFTASREDFVNQMEQ